MERFTVLSEIEKIDVLLNLSFGLTIAARDVYLQGDCPSQRKMLLAISELQHKLLSQAQALRHGQSERYPDGVFFTILDEVAKSANLEGRLQYALSKAFDLERPDERSQET